MANWKALLRAGLSVPPHVAARKAAALGIREIKSRLARRRSLRQPTFLREVPEGTLRRRITLGEFAMPPDAAPPLAAAAALYLDHRFDLLGSGWVEVRHGMHCHGLCGYAYPPHPGIEPDRGGDWLKGRINASNLAASRRIWSLIEPPYQPIDWQLDFKSGYRWSERDHQSNVRYGDKLGVDVKVPWELARLQHLPQLALVFRAGASWPAPCPPAPRLQAEFRNQVLDFIATNPPGFGVNWTCAMDVGIRIANILLALDLFIDAGARFDSTLLDIIKRSAVEHARFILAHLEWSPAGRGNHYLSDIVGVLFVAAYLPRTIETDTWLAFAIREFVGEITLQFLPDGGNIEASTAYHRLAGELATFGAALILGLDEDELSGLGGPFVPLAIHAPAPRPVPIAELGAGRRSPLPQSLFDTLAKAATLARDATKPGGDTVQWGDNDSGRLFKITPAWRRCEDAAANAAADDGAGPSALAAAMRVENSLDHRAFVAAAARLTNSAELAAWAGWWGDAEIVAALARKRQVPCRLECSAPQFSTTVADMLARYSALPDNSKRLLTIALPPGASADVRSTAYPHFGHYVLAGQRLFIAIRCPLRGFGRGPGHAHDDALALELTIDGRDVVLDPGTFVYTPLPAERNRYRAAAAHFVPRAHGDPGADLGSGLFAIAHLPASRCDYFGLDGFVGTISNKHCDVIRVVALRPDHVLIADFACAGPLAALAPANQLPPVCIGYGCQTTRSPRAF